MRSSILLLVTLLLLPSAGSAVAQCSHARSVSWPALQDAHAMARESAALAGQGRTDALRGHLAAARETALKAAAETPPADILNPIPVRLYQDDLRHDATQLGDIAALDESTLQKAVTTLSAAIESTMEQAKMDILDRPDLGPNHGLVAPFFDSEGALAGFLEITLHGNAHLECRLSTDRVGSTPSNPADETALAVTFLDHDNRVVELRAHGHDEPYHAAPTDADWLKAENLRTRITVQFTAGEKQFASIPFLLIPLAHGEAHTCAH